MRVAALVVGVMLCSAVLAADDHIVEFDHDVDFSAFRTFAIGAARTDVPTPELNNALVLKNIGDGIRRALAASGLTEAAKAPDVVVNYSFTGTAYTIGPAGRAWPMGAAPARGGPDAGVDPVRFIEGTLVIDLEHGSPGALVWRGVYRDAEKTGDEIDRKLPGEVKTLLGAYPPKKKS